MPNKPETNAVEYQINEIEKVGKTYFVTAFNKKRQQKDSKRNIYGKKHLQDTHEAEFLWIAEIFYHELLSTVYELTILKTSQKGLTNK